MPVKSAQTTSTEPMEKSDRVYMENQAKKPLILQLAEKAFKSKAAHQQVSKEYVDLWKSDEETRKQAAPEMTNDYYDLVSDFYEYGWGDSFHFFTNYKNETFQSNMKRHETYLAASLGLKPDMKVLDVGCGVGGPMREIARFSHANLTGITINQNQVDRVNAYAVRDGLQDYSRAVQGNFLDMPFASESFDAAYSIEAGCHSPTPQQLLQEIFRVLKPGGRYASYEWCLTEKYDATNAEHIKIMHDVSEGDAISKFYTIQEWLDAAKEVGFEIELAQDLAKDEDEMADRLPWYAPLTNQWNQLLTLDGILKGWKMMPVGRSITKYLVAGLEWARIAPPGSSHVIRFLNLGADGLVRSGQTGIMTPMFHYVVKKPM